MTHKLRILIVGGVAGGASAATRARRLSDEADIVLFERGKYISFANCGLPYHIGGLIPERKNSWSKNHKQCVTGSESMSALRHPA